MGLGWNATIVSGAVTELDYILLICNFQCNGWSKVDWYGAHAYYVWSKTFSLMHLKAEGNFVAGLGF